MARKPTGTITKTKTGLFQAILTLADGSRKRLPPFPKGTSEAMAREKAANYADEIKRLGIVRTPKPDVVATTEPPKTGGVYVLEGVPGWVKIGKTKNIRARIRSIQLAHHVPLRLLAVLSENEGDEKIFHKRFAPLRAHGEWFRFEGELRAAVMAQQSK